MSFAEATVTKSRYEYRFSIDRYIKVQTLKEVCCTQHMLLSNFPWTIQDTIATHESLSMASCAGESSDMMTNKHRRDDN